MDEMNRNYVLNFRAEKVIPVILEARNNNCPVLLIKKDREIFLISDFGETNSDGRRCFIAHATGFDPDGDGHVNSEAHRIMGDEDCSYEFYCDDDAFDSVMLTECDVFVEITPHELFLFIE